MKRIGVFTSGGDAPGMNANIRAVVRYGIAKGIEVFAIRRGFEGMIAGNIYPFTETDVSGIIGRGGTVIGTARSQEFMTPEGRQRAFYNLQKHNIEGLVACGGNGTFTGADIFHEEYGIPIVGTPGTIDNDIFGSDYTIGFDTAINTAMRAVDNIRDTVESHDRTFFIEVMGRDSGFIAVEVGTAVGAEFVAVPETTENFAALCKFMEEYQRTKRHIFIISEGDDYGNAQKYADDFKSKFNVDTRVTVLGHIQRGGSPTAKDRILATRLGTAAVQGLLDGKKCHLAGERKGDIVFTPLKETYGTKHILPQHLIDLIEILR
ncbi:MAG: 6-phosphofructokinase [Chlorobiota bacterium]|jgi:6-phosphofructokinase 1|nr:6-phosphofructokinase [Chlorobiota bacterium]QQS66286.1 MAG: 6-phosphofructokinase [Chlorobiota bacterium]